MPPLTASNAGVTVLSKPRDELDGQHPPTVLRFGAQGAVVVIWFIVTLGHAIRFSSVGAQVIETGPHDAVLIASMENYDRMVVTKHESFSQFAAECRSMIRPGDQCQVMQVGGVYVAVLAHALKSADDGTWMVAVTWGGNGRWENYPACGWDTVVYRENSLSSKMKTKIWIVVVAGLALVAVIAYVCFPRGNSVTIDGVEYIVSAPNVYEPPLEFVGGSFQGNRDLPDWAETFEFAQTAKSFGQWLSFVTPEFADEIGVSESNFAEVMRSATPPPDRWLFHAISVKGPDKSWMLVVGKYVGPISASVPGLVTTALSRQAGDPRWKMDVGDSLMIASRLSVEDLIQFGQIVKNGVAP